MRKHLHTTFEEKFGPFETVKCRAKGIILHFPSALRNLLKKQLHQNQKYHHHDFPSFKTQYNWRSGRTCLVREEQGLDPLPDSILPMQILTSSFPHHHFTETVQGLIKSLTFIMEMTLKRRYFSISRQF
ncbi:hypothetical protein TNCV_1999781 [Trichonephila clavipes]|nr:hypothetical protein TNCV_1999781 [Trichonephila clavipes]